KPFYALSLLAVAGLVLFGVQTALRRKTDVRVDVSAVGVLLIGWSFLLGIVIYRNLVTQSDGGTTHARFMMPAILSSSFLLCLGLTALPLLLRRLGFVALFATCLSAIGYSVWSLPHAFVTVPAFGDVESAGAQRQLQVDFASGMRAVGMSLPNQPVRAGQQLHVTLFWGTERNPNFDYSAVLRLRNDEGFVIHDQDHGPGAGVGLLPHDWQPGEVVRDDWTIAIPPTAPPGPYALELGLYDYRDLRTIEDAGGQALATLGQVQVSSGGAG
ncbi:MAG: hypothetical protein JOY71_01005, partial [Acetobacteraceae bacterium]|nr:hypothetical protein [Acetobacteraceae bacterium]